MASIEFKGIGKRFPGVVALDDVHFRIGGGSCHAVVGENGAGKSTLGKILAGVYSADGGEILLDRQPIAPRTPLEARKLGIAMVHQELAFCPNLTVAENLCLSDLPRKAGFVNRLETRSRAESMLEEVRAPIDVDAPMSQLSTAQEQLVQIAAAVGTGARVIVMDEPTSSLSAHEAQNLFDLIAELKARGITLVYVSHRMEEIFRLCDAVTVLRDGRHVSTEPVSLTNADRLVQAMVGREVAPYTFNHLTREPKEVLLTVRKLSSPDLFQDVNFNVRAGEIVGFAGLVGAGRSEVAQAVFGLDPKATGQIEVEGKGIPLGSVRKALKHGIGLLPEDRKRLGLVLAMNCRENVSLASLRALTRAGFVDRAAETQMVEQYAQKLRVKAPSMDAEVASLSGGNQQKIALAKWLARHCRILLVDEPTRGIDVGAKAEIHRLLDDLACAGHAIVVISSELPELLNLSRRIIVLREGRVVAEVPRELFAPEAILRFMAGVT